MAITAWAERTQGLLGRGPDHVAGFLAGFASAPDVFARARAGRTSARTSPAGTGGLLAEDPYFTYVIIPPQVDRSKTAQGQEEAFLQAGVLREERRRDRHSRRADAGHRFGDLELSLRQLHRPAATGRRGLRAVVRRADRRAGVCSCTAVRRMPWTNRARFDYPLSTRFDETDALIVFDDVLVPWDNVFVYRDVDLTRAQFFETPAHALGNTQAQIRLATKLKFLIGIARKIAATNRIDVLPSVQEKLGDLASLAAFVEGMILAAEATSKPDRNGVQVPNRRFLYAPMGLQAELYPRATALTARVGGRWRAAGPVVGRRS